MYSFLFIIPNCVMEVNVVHRKTISGVWQRSTYFILRQNKENEHLFLQPACLIL